MKDWGEQFYKLTLEIQDAEFNYLLLASSDGSGDKDEGPLVEGSKEAEVMGGGGDNDLGACRQRVTDLKLHALFGVALPMRTAIAEQARTADRLSDLTHRRHRIHDRVVYERACIFKVRALRRRSLACALRGRPAPLPTTTNTPTHACSATAK